VIAMDGAGKTQPDSVDERSLTLLGIDVGGTFTDAVLVAGGRIFRAKLPTTADQSEGVLAAARAVLAKAGIAAADVEGFFHGMTTATNALLERKGALTASVTTSGFRDILEIGRQNRPRLYDLCPQRPEPLVPRELRFTVGERTGPAGVTEPLMASEIDRLAMELRAAAASLAEESLELEAIALCLLFSFADPSHEQELADALASALPGVHVSLSSEVLPQFREYERFSTTAVDAYLTPVVASYLMRLGEGADAAGLPSPAIMQSSGGVLPLEQATASAAPLLLSGPAAGVVGAIFTADRSEVEDLIAFDMGGTSTDVTLVRGGAASITTEREIGGSPVALPMVDVHTIGAGGGSIAWIDSGGALRVGPESAGADPGPACYGRGGEMATVTDANLYLGYLGGRLGVDGPGLRRDLAEVALQRLARLLKITTEEVAAGIRRVANAEMVKALRVISVERGHDPRSFALAAFGGAGPMHAVDLAEELSMTKIVIPDSCGVLSALGMLVGEERRDWVRTVYSGEGLESADLAAAFSELEAGKAAETGGESLWRRADMRYRGQSHELTIDVPDSMDFTELASAFEAAHETAYGYRAEGEPVELVNIRLASTRERKPPRLSREHRAESSASRRPACFADGWVETVVYNREGLWSASEEAGLAGPLIVEDEEATTVVPPGWQVMLDKAGNLVVSNNIAGSS